MSLFVRNFNSILTSNSISEKGHHGPPTTDASVQVKRPHFTRRLLSIPATLNLIFPEILNCRRQLRSTVLPPLCEYKKSTAFPSLRLDTGVILSTGYLVCRFFLRSVRHRKSELCVFFRRRGSLKLKLPRLFVLAEIFLFRRCFMFGDMVVIPGMLKGVRCFFV